MILSASRNAEAYQILGLFPPVLRGYRPDMMNEPNVIIFFIQKKTNKTKEQLTVATGVQGFDSFLQFGQTVSVHVQNLIQMKPKKKKLEYEKFE